MLATLAIVVVIPLVVTVVGNFISDPIRKTIARLAIRQSNKIEAYFINELDKAYNDLPKLISVYVRKSVNIIPSLITMIVSVVVLTATAVKGLLWRDWSYDLFAAFLVIEFYLFYFISILDILLVNDVFGSGHTRKTGNYFKMMASAGPRSLRNFRWRFEPSSRRERREPPKPGCRRACSG